VENVQLLAGQRITLEDGNLFLEVESGQVEVYAVTSGEASFRKFYMMKVNPGEAIFPSMDDLSEINISIYAVSDTDLKVSQFSQSNPQKLKKLMKIWFQNLEKIYWLQLLTDKGDKVLLSWRKGTVLDGHDSLKDLMENFVENEQILSMFIGVRFGSEDTRLTLRTKIRESNTLMTIENSIRHLLGEEQILYDEGKQQENATVEDAAFIVRLAAKKLQMPTENITIGNDIAKKLDQVGILRRLTQKANMQIRLVTLEDDWYKNDTGVLLGFYGKDKTLAAILPDEPYHYKIFTRDFKDGIDLNDAEVKNLAKDAFMCYSGFPSRALKVLDLLKYMFNACWKADYRTVILTSLIAGLVPLATPIITETIFQDIIPILDRQGLATVTQALMVTSFTMAALSIVRSIAVMRISTKIEISSEAALWGRLMTLPTKFFRRYTVGELASRMGCMGVIKGLISGGFVGTVFSFIFSFWSVFLMCYYSLKLTAAAIAVWIVYSIFIFFVCRRVIEFNRKLIACGNKTAGTVQQIFAGLSKFRVQGAEERAYNLWTRDYGEQWNWGLNFAGKTITLQ